MTNTTNFFNNITHHLLFENTKNIEIIKQDDVKIFYLNVNSIKSTKKFYEFESFVRELSDFDIIILCETNIDAGSESFYNLTGYISFHNTRTRQGGGSAIYVKPSLQPVLRFTSGKDEIEFLVVHLRSLNINVCAIYRPPINSNVYYQKFFKQYENILAKFNNLINFGDININLLTPLSPVNLQYLNLITSNNFGILNYISEQTATRSTATTNTLIDHISSDMTTLKYNLCLGDSSDYDHRFAIVGVKIPNLKITAPKAISFNQINFQQVSKNLINLQKRATDFENFHELLQIDIKANTKKKTFTEHSNKKNNNLWFTKELKATKNLKDYYYKLFKAFPSNPHLLTKYKQYKYQLSKEIIKEKKDYFSKKFFKAGNNPKSFWKIIKEITSNNITPNKIKQIKIKHENIVYEEPYEVSNIINVYFTTVGSNILQGINDTTNITHEPPNAPDCNTFFETFTPTTKTEIEIHIKSLKNGCAAGYDKINSYFIKANINFFSQYLSDEINLAFEHNYFPNSLKIARVTAVFKSGDPCDVSNYRPISVLPAFSKIYELCMKARLTNFLSNQNIIHKSQFGFIAKSSTTSACTALMNQIMESMDASMKTAATFLDLKKAFDCLNYSNLSKMLSKIGIRGKALKLIESYLFKRCQTVVVDGVEGETLEISCGTPQGGVLSSMLFIIYINQIFNLPLQGSIQCYADDTCITYSKKNFNDLKLAMIKDLEIVTNFLLSINLVVNTNKTHFIIFKARNMNLTNIFDSLNINNQIIHSVNEYKYLGLIIDDKLNWSNHVSKIAKKIAPYVGIFRRLKYYVNIDTLYMLYFAYIDCHLTYLLPVWGSAPDTYIHTLKVLQNKCIKIILNKPSLTPSVQLYSPTFLSLNQKIFFELSTYIYKVLNNLIKCNIPIITYISESNVTTRNADNLRPPNFKGALAQNSIFYRGINLFNSLPKELQNLNRISLFKTELKKYIANNYPVR